MHVSVSTHRFRALFHEILVGAGIHNHPSGIGDEWSTMIPQNPNNQPFFTAQIFPSQQFPKTRHPSPFSENIPKEHKLQSQPKLQSRVVILLFAPTRGAPWSGFEFDRSIRNSTPPTTNPLASRPRSHQSFQWVNPVQRGGERRTKRRTNLDLKLWLFTALRQNSQISKQCELAKVENILNLIILPE